jgi:hypothetical protein
MAMKTFEADDYSGIAARLREIQAEKANTQNITTWDENIQTIADTLSESLGRHLFSSKGIEYFAQNLYMPWTTVEFDKAEDEGDRWISYSEKNRFPEYTDEELEEYVRNIPGSFWPLALDAYQDVDTNDKEGSIEWM